MPRHNKTIPHQPYRPQGNQGSKKRYQTKREADEAAAYQMTLKPELHLRVYKCLTCNGWHLTGQYSRNP